MLTASGLDPQGPVPEAADDLADRPRKIIHVDMDAFYASVEQRDDPALRGKPVAVGGSRERGVVAAASYEARAFGVRSAMASVTARRQCPDLVFVKPRFEVYKAISHQIRAIFAEYTTLIEPLSLDEAYLDVSQNHKGETSATRLAGEIRTRIRAETGLTASAGVSYNKFLAKLASDHRKPDGLFVIKPRLGPVFIEDLPISRFHGIGPATTSRMNQFGIFTGRDLRERELSFLTAKFGKSGPYYHAIARGIDHRPVRADRERKSIGAETTFSSDLTGLHEMEQELRPLIEKVWRYCEAGAVRARTVVLKVKYADFTQVTRSRTSSASIADRDTIERHSNDLLSGIFPLRLPVRLLGVTISGLSEGHAAGRSQLDLGL